MPKATARVVTMSMETTKTGPALILLSGPHADRRLALNRAAVLFGSHASCDFRFADAELAEIHCAIVQSPQGLIIRDCKSPGGTFVNGMAVAETRLRSGDHVQLGNLQFRVQLPADEIDPLQRQLQSTQKQLQRQQRRRARLAQLAWRQRTLAQLQCRRLAELEHKLSAAAPRAHEAESVNGDVAKLREELFRRREQLEEFRKELDKREADLMAQQQQLLDQAARAGRSERRGSPAEAAAARKEMERLKVNIARLTQEEAKLLENLSNFRTLEAEQKSALAAVQKQLKEQQAKLLPEALLGRDQIAALQRHHVHLATEVEKLEQHAQAAKKKAEQLQDEVAAVEDELNRLRLERERENEAYAREREVQVAAFNAHRQEMLDLGEEKKRFLAERARQIEELAAKESEVSRKLASFGQFEESLRRQREAVHHETENWVEQRQLIIDELGEREKEIEALREQLKALRAEEAKLQANIADWNAHADQERKTLYKEVHERRANLDAEMQATKKALMAQWFEIKEDVDEGLRQFRSQAEQLWEEFLNRLRHEATELTELIPKEPPG